MAAATLLAAMTGLAGCSSVIDHVPTWAGGMPDGVPERAATQPAYPAVHDMPPARADGGVLSDAERKKLKDELNAMRSQTESNISAAETTGAATAPAGAPPQP